MDVNLIISIIAGAGGIAGFAGLIQSIATLKNTQRAGEIANESNAVDALQKTIDAFEDVIEDLKKERNEAKEEARQERDRAEAYRQSCLTAEGGFCTNYGCPLRTPARGLGAAWIKEHAGTPEIGGNYKNLPALMAEKGITCQSETSESDDQTDA